MAFRNRDIPGSELIDALWGEEESENPSDALKNLIYRARALLERDFPAGREMILRTRGGYRWNPQLDTRLDAEEFEGLLKEAGKEDTSDLQRVEKYEQALSLYKGDFLPKSATNLWVIPLATYYHGRYVAAVEELIELLFRLDRPEAVTQLCESAICMERYEEKFHVALIRSLILQGQQHKALAHYEQVTQQFYRELGTRPSESLRGLYREIIKNVSHVEADLQVVKEDLREAEEAPGVFVCEYEVFKNIYRLEARSILRSGRSVFVAMLTLMDEQRRPPDKKWLDKGMQRLLETVCHSLRRGDIISRFSPTQYVLLLPALTYENGQMVLERILQCFKRENPRLPLQIHTSLLPLEPIRS